MADPKPNFNNESQKGKEGGIEKVKKISFQVAANIANSLTNHLYLGENGGPRESVDPKKAHVSSNSIGGREYTLESDAKPQIEKDEDGEHWKAFSEKDVNFLKFKSATSGAILEMKKISDGNWELKFSDTRESPEYKSQYEVFFESPESVPEFDAVKMYKESGRESNTSN